MMRIKLLRNVLVEGEHYGVGEIVEVDQRLGNLLIQWGRAEAAEDGRGANVGGRPETTTAEPAAETAVKPAAKKRGK